MRRMFLCLHVLLILCVSTYASLVREGYYNGKHWEIKVGGTLIVDGEVVLSGSEVLTTYAIQFETGGEPYFLVTLRNKIGEYYPDGVYSITGKAIIPCVNYDIRPTKRDAVTNYYSDLPYQINGCEKLDDIYIQVVRYKGANCDLYSLEGDKIISNYKGITVVELNSQKLFKVEKNEGLGLYSAKGRCLIEPKYKLIDFQRNQNNQTCIKVKDNKENVGFLDDKWNWLATPDRKFSDIYTLNVCGTKYFQCRKNGFWGLYDEHFNEVLAPEFDNIEGFDGTNYIKFQIEGYWGVMTLQSSTNTTKTIIPTTRGYTSIGRYIKSQKRFTYTMAGYKGECDATTGRQLSKIKEETPQQQVVVKQEETPQKENKKVEEIIIKHDPIPVQQWQACFACGGMGTMGCDNCGGGGTKYIGDRLHRCSRCNGRGIIPCNVCYGNKGQYITVYQ